MKRMLYLVLVTLALSQPATAQTVDYWELSFYNQGAPSPFIGPLRITQTDASCSQPEQGGGSNVNPTRVVWDDPVDSTKDCVAFTTQGQIIGFPTAIGNYEGTLRAINSIGTSPESARAPFVRADAPGAPTNLRIVR